ncbi:CBR-GUR-5 protein [Ditylenchus destructor]|nr:CBR-GUR-5 protein [Ditylenchus destructor]
MLIITLLKLTGLYFDKQERGKLGHCLLVTRAVILFTITTLSSAYFFYSTLKIAVGQSAASFNVEHFFTVCWVSQAALSTIFVLQWHCNGSLEFVLEQIFDSLPQYPEGKSTHKVITVFVIGSMTVTAIFNVMNWVLYPYDGYESLMDIELIIDVLHSFLSIYGQFVWRLVLGFFCLTTRAIALQLKDFNERLRIMLNKHATISGSFIVPNRALDDDLLDAFDEHNRLGERVQRMDEIFKVYTFVMLIGASSSTIFGFLAIIRQRSWIHSGFFIYDVLGCFVHLLGLCIFPAQIYTKFRAAQQILYRQTSLWINYDLKIYQIAKMFTENAGHSNVGITLWGYTLITKSLILTCISLVIPYVVLFLQLKVGTEYVSWRMEN